MKEIRWTGEGIIDKTNCIIFYRCDKKHHAFGTGFIISKRIKQLVTNLKVKTLRPCKIRVRGLFFNYSVIYMHVPKKKKMMMKRITSMKIWTIFLRTMQKET